MNRQTCESALEGRKRTKVSGKTRVNPETSAKKKGRSIARKLARLEKRVQKLCRKTDAPPIALVYVDRGTVKITGTPQLCKAIGGEKGEALEALITPVIQAKAVESLEGPKKTVSLKGIDPFITWQDVSVPILRQACAQICTEEGDSTMTRYSIEKKPGYWPKDVPFCSHSRENEVGGRLLNGSSLQKIMSAFCDYCLQKIADGYLPVDIPKSTSVEMLQQIARGTYEVQKIPEPNLSHIEEVMETSDFENKKSGVSPGQTSTNEMNECKYEETDTDNPVSVSDLGLIKKNDISSLKALMISDTQIHDDIISSVLIHEKLTFISQPPKRIRNYTGPEHLCPGSDATNVWHLLNSKPDLSQLLVWQFAKTHLEHYVSQYKNGNVDVEEMKAALGNTGLCTTPGAILQEEIRHLLTDETPNTAGWLFIAGALLQEVAVYYENGKSCFYPPCPCNVDDHGQVQFYIDSKQRIYPLSQRKLWRASSVHTRKKVEDTIPCSNEERNHVTLPGMTDGPLFSCFGYEVWKGEVDRLRQGRWLDDSIVNVLLRNEKENHDDVAFIDSTFARKYLVPKNTPDLGQRLPLTASNLDDVQTYYSRLKLGKLRLIVLPVCDNTHWFLAAFAPIKSSLYIMCSLGKKPKRAADSLKRFFQHIYGSNVNDIHIEYPNVPRQGNGDDCGVFTIEYGINLMKTSEPNWSILAAGNRSEIASLIQTLY